jgi:hypothetical protein
LSQNETIAYYQYTREVERQNGVKPKYINVSIIRQSDGLPKDLNSKQNAPMGKNYPSINIRNQVATLTT